MGYYTALQVSCTLKPEFVPVVAYLQSEERSKQDELAWWMVVARRFPQYPFFAEFAADERCDFIPFGGGGHMPYALCGHCGRFDVTVNEELACSHCLVSDRRNLFDSGWFLGSERDWKFVCTLKNYESTIEHFLEKVLPEMIENLELCRTQTEDGFEVTYTLQDGKLVATSHRALGDLDDYHPFGR